MLTINVQNRTIHGFYVQASEDCEAGFEFIDVGESYGPSLAQWVRFRWSVEYYFREAGASQIDMVE